MKIKNKTIGFIAGVVLVVSLLLNAYLFSSFVDCKDTQLALRGAQVDLMLENEDLEDGILHQSAMTEVAADIVGEIEELFYRTNEVIIMYDYLVMDYCYIDPVDEDAFAFDYALIESDMSNIVDDYYKFAESIGL
ncbi:hypothetical protein KJ742_05770, partial [Patescibacteria group bacterium]|nr:hypothetical protein [Patescibacteria group bacterium]